MIENLISDFPTYNPQTKNAMKKLVTALFALVLSIGSTQAQISITSGSFVYTENFDTLANSGTTSSTTPTGWTFFETGTGANTTYGIGPGSSNTGNTYSFGSLSATDRAFGSLQSGSVNPIIGASFKNDTGTTITDIAISYNGEQWRLGTAGRTDKLIFEYSLDATSLSTGTWTAVTGLDFTAPNTTSPIGSLDGNASGNFTNISSGLTSINFKANATLWIRWTDLNASGPDDGLGVDDFQITSVTLPVQLAAFTAETQNGNVTLNWNTVSEINSDVFEVQELVAGNWTTVRTVSAKGSATEAASYTEVFSGLSVGTHTFRLKKVDKDGQVHFSNAISVTVEVPGTFVMNPAYPNPFNPQSTVTFAVAAKQNVTMNLYNVLGQHVATLYNGTVEANTLQTVRINGAELKSGTYLVRLIGENFSSTQRVTLLK